MTTKIVCPILPTTKIHDRSNSITLNKKLKAVPDPTFGSLTNRTN